MNRAPKKRAQSGVLGLFPEMMRIAVAEDAKFRERHQIQVESILTVGVDLASFAQSKFYQAVRRAHARRDSKTPLSDTLGREWTAGIETVDGDTRLALRRADQGIILPDFFPLDGDRARRLSRFSQDAKAANLPADAQLEWARLLRRRALKDEETSALRVDLFNTPVRILGAIPEELEGGLMKMTTLVPKAKAYYERLVGAPEGAADISSYTRGVTSPHIAGLISWDAVEGTQLAVLLAAHGSIMADVPDEWVDRIDFGNLIKWALAKADPFSRLGVFELAMRRISAQTDLERPLIELLKSLLGEDPAAPEGALHLMSACFMLVEGELSRSRVLADWKPFRRRLASMAQAALITRQTMGKTNSQRFAEWAFEQRAYPFFCQSLVDLRLEPRWLPDLATPEQFYHEMMGRLTAVGTLYAEDLPAGELRDLLTGQVADGLSGKVTFWSFSPGPLEGTFNPPGTLPDNLAETIRNSLSAPNLNAKSFAALVNSRLAFNVDPSYVDLAISSLQGAKYRLDSGGPSELTAALFGLAALAASERRLDLAAEIRILARHHRRSGGEHVSALEELRVAVTAAAAHEHLDEWGKFIGDWALELGFEITSKDEAEVLLTEVTQLARTSPELSRFLDRSRAALLALADM